MGQKKLIRFEAIKTFPNVLQNPPGMKGKWNEFFRNNNPITLELACGKAEYTVSLGRMYPERNFIGVDLKGNRLYIGAKKSLAEGLTNTSFLRIQIEAMQTYFADGEADEIWITFPDPQLRTSKAKKRLTHPRFLRLYQQVLRKNGFVHLKTDSTSLYNFTLLVAEMYGLDIVTNISDLHAGEEISPELKIKTHYESLDIAGSNRIYYLKFRLPEARIPDLDAILLEKVKETEITGVEQGHYHEK
ncbi:MAG: tRNA (guanosine(46)-N7)-methyltransferase TrmB [Gemmatimonadaceae bacterium]|nr:tRNA (guanosine(46)-N7)-methyltransferase TrmB [Chitinophagaceae bacterium]